MSKKRPLIMLHQDQVLIDVEEERKREEQTIKEKRVFLDKQVNDFHSFIEKSQEVIMNKYLDRLKDLELIEDSQVDISIEDGVVYQYEERDSDSLSDILSSLFRPLH